jgi:acetylornithine deacetylase/succinyl-diaminopimelate desuccinylase-like protein
MLRVGLTQAEVIPTDGHPVVYGEWLGAPGKPTVLVYGHYDVQPVEPLDLWISPPFAPTVRDGRLYARGSIDDKGQVYIHLAAIEAFLRSSKGAAALPVNLRFIVEGEEEIGSEHLEDFLQKERERLSADIVVVSDTPMFAKGVPSICYGLRGMAYLEIEVHGPATDVHSGSYGGGIDNPANVLARIVAALKNPAGVIEVPGFYERVRPLDPEERAALNSLPFDEASWLAGSGAPAAAGEQGYSLIERLWTRPTLDVCGLLSGYTGEGAKTIIPAWARAKVSMRLVPDQDPDEIANLVARYVEKISPPTVKATVKNLHGAPAWVAPRSHPAFEAARRALQKGFDHDVVLVREGGSIPFVRTISDELGIPCLLVGYGLPDENAHAPNEWLDLDNFQRGAISTAWLYRELSELGGI